MGYLINNYKCKICNECNSYTNNINTNIVECNRKLINNYLTKIIIILNKMEIYAFAGNLKTEKIMLLKKFLFHYYQIKIH